MLPETIWILLNEIRCQRALISDSKKRVLTDSETTSPAIAIAIVDCEVVIYNRKYDLPFIHLPPQVYWELTMYNTAPV